MVVFHGPGKLFQLLVFPLDRPHRVSGLLRTRL